ncbi:MAG: hypothetical protein Q8Q59_11850 [Luteolibacter sp.]|nr:hypothetical protein [Luteolibacter sp.]
MSASESGSKRHPSCLSFFPLDRGLVALVLVYSLATAWMWWAIHSRTGEISYTVDDAYIHGTMAKNIAASGTFGIIPGEFSAASSSPLWTLLLALVFLVTGPQPWTFALLATLFGALTIERSNSLLKAVGVAQAGRVMVCILAMAYAPTLPIISTGMEHTFHAWTMVGLFGSLVAVSRNASKNPGAIFLWALLAGGARYESLFALPPLLIWLAWHRRWRFAFALGAGMTLPAITFAAYSLAHGGFALPNSLMLKGNLAGVWKIKAFQVVMENQYVLVLCLLLLVAAGIRIFGGKWRGKKLTWLPVSVFAMILIHLQLAQLGWFYRYEGYLVILGLIAASVLLPPLQDWMRKLPLALSLSVYVILAFTTLPLAWRSVRATGEIVHAAANIRDQQLQMALVTRHLGNGARVAVNDLGAVSFLTSARVLDLYGLGDNRLTRAKRNRTYGSNILKARLEETRTDYVICYPSWYLPPDQLPETLIPVETWALGDNLICGSDKVVFYGTSPEAAGKMAAALEAYRARTPPASRSTNRMYPVTPHG